jgi:NitT/TauT family transport system ATP-binding protein
MCQDVNESKLVELRDVTLSHGGALVVRDVTIDIQPGTVSAVVGRSGSGKTTLIRCLAGLLEPTRGTRLQARSAQIAMVFQDPTLLPWLTVEENVVLPGKLRGFKIDVGQLLDRFLLTGCRQQKPTQLSGGMQQRVALARAFACRPNVLLMDEPYRSLDESTRELLYEDLRRLLDPGNLAILLVTHSLSEAWLLADTIFVLAGMPARFIAKFRVDRTSHEHEKRVLSEIRAHLHSDIRGML